ncbi:MAG: DNA polymerase III subunit gamma/tau, partial [Tepidisphaeraceae bacterium]
MSIGFDDIIGQQRAIGAIHQAMRSERLPHGLIFEGPVGVGKGTVAGILAKWFLCLSPTID